MYGLAMARGMLVTLKNFAKKPFTVQYPEERVKQHPRFRGEEFVWYEERCTGCASCAKFCPLGIIKIVTSPSETAPLQGDKYRLEVFDIDISRCMFCGLCVEACPYDALFMGADFERASYRRDDLVITKEQLIEAFSIERLGKSPAKFDLKKLQWLNGQHIRSMTAEDLLAKVLPILEETGFDTASKPREWLARMVHICQEKIGTLNGIVQFTDFFFVKPAAYEPKGVKKHWRKEGAVEGLEAIGKVFDECDPWTHEALHTAFETLAEQSGVGLGQLVHPARLALTGKSVGPGLFELAELLGRETCRDRIAKAIEYVATLV